MVREGLANARSAARKRNLPKGTRGELVVKGRTPGRKTLLSSLPIKPFSEGKIKSDLRDAGGTDPPMETC